VGGWGWVLGVPRGDPLFDQVVVSLAYPRLFHLRGVYHPDWVRWPGAKFFRLGYQSKRKVAKSKKRGGGKFPLVLSYVMVLIRRLGRGVGGKWNEG